MINIFCVRPAGFNIGNDTIFVGLRHLLRRTFEEPINLVQVPAVRGEAGSLLYGLLPRSIHEMNQYGHGVVVGGGNLYENGALEINPTALEALRVPLMLFSLSYGRIYDRHHQLVPRTDAMAPALVTALNRRAVLSVARDTATLSHLRALGLSGVTLGGCPSLLLGDMPATAVRPDVPAGGTYVSVRNPRLMSVPICDEARVHGIVQRTVALLERLGYGPVRLLCHDTRDLEFAASFDTCDYVLPDDVHAYLQLLREARLVVSFRLHAFVPCVSFGTPAINISYDERSASLVETIGFADWAIDFVRSPDVVEAIADRCARLDEYAACREAARPRWDALEREMRTAAASFAGHVRQYCAGESRFLASVAGRS